MDICEKIAYIKGLAEGLNLDETTKEGKILAAVIDLLGDITDDSTDIEWENANNYIGKLNGIMFCYPSFLSN